MELKELEYSNKSKTELIAENELLRKRIVEFEKSLSHEDLSNKTYDRLQHDLLQRVKELNCLYCTIKLIEEYDMTLSSMFQKAVTFIPPAFQYPDITCARITFGDNRFITKDFKETKWKLSTDIIVANHKVGCIDVFYLQVKPQKFEGPFIKEERNLLDTLGKQLSIIADRKITEETLIENEKRLKSIFNAANNISFILTNLDEKDALILEFSPGSENIFGYKRDEVIKKPISILHTTENINKFSDAVQVMLKEKKGVSEELELVRKSGERFSSLYTVYPVFDVIGKMKYALNIAIDITELKTAQEKIKRREETTNVLINTSFDSMILIDRDYKVILINDIAAKRFNLKADTFKGKSIFDFLPMKVVKTRKAIGEEVLESKKPKQFVDERNGYIFENNIHPILDSKGEVYMLAVYARDITEKAKTELSIKASREQLRNLSAHLQTVREEERASIAREIHDDLGQLLTAAKINISELEKFLPKRKKEESRRINNVKRLLDSASGTIHKISTDLRPSILDDLGLSAAIEWQADEFHKHTGIKCNIKIKPEEIVLDDKLSITLYRIVQEALTNVTRHSRATKVDVSLTKQNNNLCLTVKDNGVGINEEKINHPYSYGLIGIRERILFWKGTFDIVGIKDKGTTLTINISLNDN